MKKALGIFLSIILVLPLSVLKAEAAASNDDFSYEISSNNSIVITGYIGTSMQIIIPSEIDGISVTDIGTRAFYNCSSLTDITIPNSLVNIGDWAFYGCSSLTSITIPDKVASIGEGAFAYCSSLLNIFVSPNNAIYEQINGVLYDKFKKVLHSFPCGKAETDYQIPDGILIIENWAFLSCSSLTRITIPDSMTSIGERAFATCTSLTSITIPHNVKNIGLEAFVYCSSLLNIFVSPDNAVYEQINGVLFDKALKMIHSYPCGKEETSYLIPDDTLIIGVGAFSGCRGLTNIMIPDNAITIEEEAFAFCSNLTSISIMDSVTSIGDRAFDGCPNLFLTVNKGSYAQQYAEDNQVQYNFSSAPD